MNEITSATDALEAQFAIMRVQAKRADERGYMVLVHGLNPDANDYGFLYAGFSMGLQKFFEARRARGSGRRIVVVNVYPAQAAAITGKPFDGPLHFSVELPRTRSWRSICATLALMSAKNVRNQSGWAYEKRGTGVFTWTEKSGSHEYTGDGRTALETLLRILEIPQHRDAMAGN